MPFAVVAFLQLYLPKSAKLRRFAKKKKEKPFGGAA